MQPVGGGRLGQAVGDSCAASAYDVGCEGLCLGAADWESCQGGAESPEWSGALGAGGRWH